MKGRSSLFVAFALALVMASAVTCATSSSRVKRPPVCASGLCATLIDADGARLTVEVTATPRAWLHNAWVAPAGGWPCRGGRALNAVASDAGVRLSGPLPLGGAQRLALGFVGDREQGVFLDLDVRLVEGRICLRLPLAAAASVEAWPRPLVVRSDAGVASGSDLRE